MSEIGYPLTKTEFLNEVQHVLDIDGRETPFKNNRPGKDWFRGFLGRHTEMSFRKSMALDHERFIVNIEKNQPWYTGVHTYLDKVS